MTNKSRIRTLIIFLFLAIFSFTLYLTSQKQKWNIGWGKGLLSISERKYYSNRIIRIIENWRQAAHQANNDITKPLPESYKTYFIIDLEKKALWIEENGQIRTENCIELSPETKWSLYHITPEGYTELSGRTALKIRGLATNWSAPERFNLVGQGIKGYIVIDFNSHYKYASYNAGPFVMRSIKIQPPTIDKDLIYSSVVATNEEYEQYLDTISDSNVVAIENEKIKAWNKIEKYLYMEFERQFPKKGYDLTNTEIKPGPDYSAARAYINIRKTNILERITDHRSKHHGYSIYIDHLGNDIWYAKNVPNPHPDPSGTEENKPVLDFEFLTSPNGFIKGSKRVELLKKGREFQQAPAVPESKWKMTLSNGAEFEFLGIHDNTNPDAKWWGPDGSLLDYIPNYNKELYDPFISDDIICEVAWRSTPNIVSDVTLEGGEKFILREVINRYGDRYLISHGTKVFKFDNYPQMTTFKAKVSITDWKIPLQISNKPGEINFLNKKRIVLNPPEIENEQLIVKCYEESYVELTEYKTDFAIIVNNGSETKTVSLTNFARQRPHEVKEGMNEYAYIIKDYNIDQIEGVCFRYQPYQPYSYIIFKNISLVPGQDQGFEIEVIEAEE